MPGIGYATFVEAAEDIGAERDGDRFFIEDNPELTLGLVCHRWPLL